MSHFVLTHGLFYLDYIGRNSIISGENQKYGQSVKTKRDIFKDSPFNISIFCWTEVKLQFILGIASNESTETLTNIDDTLLDTSERLKENAV